LDEFFQGPGQACLKGPELLTEIRIPKPNNKTLATFMKKGRVKMDLALASISVLLQMDGQLCQKARIAAGSVAPVPLRLTQVESLLEGKTLTRELIAHAKKLASTSVSPISDIRASESYRRHLVGVYLQRAVYRLLGWKQE
jgi:carbon-monoxide dehydrogenase medium subunit